MAEAVMFTDVFGLAYAEAVHALVGNTAGPSHDRPRGEVKQKALLTTVP